MWIQLSTVTCHDISRTTRWWSGKKIGTVWIYITATPLLMYCLEPTSSYSVTCYFFYIHQTNIPSHRHLSSHFKHLVSSLDGICLFICWISFSLLLLLCLSHSNVYFPSFDVVWVRFSRFCYHGIVFLNAPQSVIEVCLTSARVSAASIMCVSRFNAMRMMHWLHRIWSVCWSGQVGIASNELPSWKISQMA